MTKVSVQQVKKNIMLSMIAQIISLIVSLLMNLILPRYIDEYQYAYWQTYLLYIGYVGIFHFGILDGIVLRYSQYDYEQLDKPRIRSQFIAIFVISVIMAVICSCIACGIYSGDMRNILILVSIGIVTRNISNYTLYTFQITNRIDKYARMVISFRTLNAILVVLMLIFDRNWFYWLCISDLVCDVFGVVISLGSNKGLYFGKLIVFKDMIGEVCINISSGIMLTLSNWTSFLLSGCSRFVIKHNWGDLIFGKISFSFSVINLFLVFISAASVVLFPSLKRMEKEQLPILYVKVKRTMTLLLYGIMIFFYPGCRILAMWLPSYEESLRYMGLLLPIIIYSTKINLLTNNYLKAYRKEKLLLCINIVSVLFTVVGSMTSAFVLNNLWCTLIITVLGFVVSGTIADIVVSKLTDINVLPDLCCEYFMTVMFVISSLILCGFKGTLVYTGVYIAYALVNRELIMSFLKKDRI